MVQGQHLHDNLGESSGTCSASGTRMERTCKSSCAGAGAYTQRDAAGKEIRRAHSPGRAVLSPPSACMKCADHPLAGACMHACMQGVCAEELLLKPVHVLHAAMSCPQFRC